MTNTLAAATAFGLQLDMVDADVYARTVERFRANRIALPTFGQLADPHTIAPEVRKSLGEVRSDEPHAANLYRVHWFNQLDGGGPLDVPEHVELPPALTGVDARIVLAFGNRFPMIGAHKVLAAYACLVPRIVTGQFDPTRDRAVWPSTGNYARGGVAISRIMGCRGVAVLPAGMSRERFDWLDRWIADPADVIRTPGTESNVKEIYDKCAELRLDARNVILNQFCEFGNHLAHLRVTGPALERIYEHVTRDEPGTRLAAFVSASGSAGTLGAGDYLKDRHGSRVVAVEALECPTMLENGYGEHNIQGIGDKHIPLIHNVMNTDIAIGVSDRSTDALGLMFDEPAGRAYLTDRVGADPAVVDQLTHLGFSSICNALAAIKVAKHLGLGSDDVIMTVATDGSEMYGSERAVLLASRYPDGYGSVDAAATFGEHLAAVDTSALLELGATERRRIFNLGYYTWVEQQGVSVADFDARRDQAFWRSIRPFVDAWDERIVEFNERTGVLADLAR
ncbi:MAG TPA: pyridoxal-phosphate dependent enzyme [Acidimicrobiales bacterium]|nr:pyridoxal-phosphate dependent enzyme [Acidimicrobiales bacterium]